MIRRNKLDIKATSPSSKRFLVVPRIVEKTPFKSRNTNLWSKRQKGKCNQNDHKNVRSTG